MSGFVIVSEDALADVSRGYLALGALSGMMQECNNYARGNPSWDKTLSIPAESMGALLACVRSQFDHIHAPGAQKVFTQNKTLTKGVSR